MDSGLITALAGLITGAAMLISVIIAFKAVKESKRASLGTTMTSCVQQYQAIFEFKNDSIKMKDADDVKQSFQELFGLYWSETYLWVDGMIPDYIMLHWVNTWASAFDADDKIVVNNEIITYKQQWEDAQGKAFRSDECFKELLNEIHEYGNKEIKPEDLAKLKKEFKAGLKKFKRKSKWPLHAVRRVHAHQP
ncbi:MAG: hypothetical protein WC370_10175 [Dehalococcoidales bacterium]|jgi:hypothetical protein